MNLVFNVALDSLTIDVDIESYIVKKKQFLYLKLDGLFGSLYFAYLSPLNRRL